MIKIKGGNTEAKVYTDILEKTAEEQIKNMLDHEITKNTQVRIMPDVHAGKGSTIGTTIKLSEDFADWKVCPNIVGVDVGCGIFMYKLADKNIDLKKLDEVVNQFVPAGFNVHQDPQDYQFSKHALDNLTINIAPNSRERIHQSLGTLGGGNHFIELGVDEDGSYWLSVHSGSRNLGVKVAGEHQKKAIKILKDNQVNLKQLIKDLKAEGRHSEIQAAIAKAKKETPVINHEVEIMAYLEGQDLKDYLKDMDLAQEFASKSREIMLNIIVDAMEFEVVDKFDSVHNFVEHDNFKNGIIRKGATSAKVGERLVIPLNMRDGALICVGKGNEDWNESAPHGAGRVLSRMKAREQLDLEEFKTQMGDVYTTSVGENTIDEAPGAYKPAEAIIDNIKPTVDILHIVKPVYNFKAH